MMVDTDAAQSPNAKSLAASLDALFAPWDRTDAPGLVVGVARGGQVLYRRGFGMASLEFDVAVTPATRMRIGSTSKHFTALLALQN
jgi:D-aminopeptidase